MRFETHRPREGPVETAAETGIIVPRAAGGQGPPQTAGGKEGSPTEQLAFSLLAPRTVTE